MAGLFSSVTLEQVRAANDIVDVIGAVVPLKRAAANFVALCPFHKEKTPSFNVNPQRQIFHCFGCHKGGDVFRFLQEYENLSFPEAVRRLADRAKIPLELEASASSVQNRFLKDTLLDIHEQLAKRWQGALNEAGGEVARAYLSQRGVSNEAVKLFRIGYAPETWDDTVNWARSKGFDLNTVEQAGLIIRKEEESRYYDRFRGRLMFPVCDELGRVVAFSGRILNSDPQGRKYVNSPETPIFTKGRIMYGLDKSKRALLESHSAVVCEGQLDLIACYMAGVHNIVAPQGTAFTPEHARILKRYVDEVVLCFDSDAAGQNASVRIFESLLASGLAIRVATVPAPHDPDSFIKEHGSAAFVDLIQRAVGFFDFYLDRLCSINDVRTDKGQVLISRAMSEALHKTGNSVLIDKYAQKTALRLGVSPDAARREFSQNASAPSRVFSAPVSQTAEQPVQRPSPHEFWLLKIILSHDELVPWLEAHLNRAWLQHEQVKQIVCWRFSARSTQESVTAMLGRIEDDSLRVIVTEVLASERPIPNPQQQLSDIVLRLRNQTLDEQINSAVTQACQPELPEPQRIEFLRLAQELRLRKAEPLAPLPQGNDLEAGAASSPDAGS